MPAVKDVDKGWNKIRGELERARGREVVVGILEGSKSEGESIAEYAAHNEFGTEDIPDRPFMRTAFDENVTNIDKDFQRQAKLMTAGTQTANGALTTIGMKHAGRVQTVITGRNFLPKLADSTVRAKKGSTKTLVDSGAMVNAVTIQLRGRT